MEDLREQAKEKQSLLAIAHYNLGCQQEYLKEFVKSMESYRKAVLLERTKAKGQNNQTSPILEEFVKSYKDMKRRLAATSVKRSLRSYDRNKQTFSGLNKQQVDLLTNVNSSHNQIAQSQHSYARMASKKTEIDSIPHVPSKFSLSKNSQANPSHSQERKKRPMSAKIPQLQNRFIKHEASMPHLVGDDIINIQNNIINEEHQAMPEYHQFTHDVMNDQIMVRPQSKPKKPRPVSSYVKTSQVETFSKKSSHRVIQDQFYLNSSIQNIQSNKHLAESSDVAKTSNIDSISNVLRCEQPQFGRNNNQKRKLVPAKKKISTRPGRKPVSSPQEKVNALSQKMMAHEDVYS